MCLSSTQLAPLHIEPLINPTAKQMEESRLDLVLAGTEDAVGPTVYYTHTAFIFISAAAAALTLVCFNPFSFDTSKYKHLEVSRANSRRVCVFVHRVLYDETVTKCVNRRGPLRRGDDDRGVRGFPDGG